MRAAASAALAVLLVAGCAMAPSPATGVRTLYVENDSGMAVALTMDGVSLGTIEPGFRGPVTSLGDPVNAPRTIALATVGGTHLADWQLTDAKGSFAFFPDPRCGRIELWLNDPSASFEAVIRADPSECPR